MVDDARLITGLAAYPNEKLELELYLLRLISPREGSARPAYLLMELCEAAIQPMFARQQYVYFHQAKTKEGRR